MFIIIIIIIIIIIRVKKNGVSNCNSVPLFSGDYSMELERKHYRILL